MLQGFKYHADSASKSNRIDVGTQILLALMHVFQPSSVPGMWYCVTHSTALFSVWVLISVPEGQSPFTRVFSGKNSIACRLSVRHSTGEVGLSSWSLQSNREAAMSFQT